MSTVYINAAASLTSFLNKQGGLKSLLFSSSSSPLPPSHAKQFALVSETLRYKEVLDEVVDQCALMRLDKRMSRPLLLVMLYDLLFGSKAIEGGGHVKRLLLQQRTPIHSALARIFIRRGASTALQLLPPALRPRAPHPRYVRVNPLLTSLAEAVAALEAAGFRRVEGGPTSLAARSFCLDAHVPSLLVFPPGTVFHDSPLYLSSALVLQDKASCFPALCLNPGPEDVVVDGCAAPGNKTSHVLALMKEKAAVGGPAVRVDAFEVDFKRFGLLCDMMRRKGAQLSVDCSAGCHGAEKAKAATATAAGGARVTAHHASFLSLDGREGLGQRVTAALLDPTCSGSGMMHTIDAYYKQKGAEQSKAEKVAQRKDRKRLTLKGHSPQPPPPWLKRKRPSSDDVGEEDEEETAAEGKGEEDGASVENKSTATESLASLSAFQLSLLLHAFTLPSLTRLVYSTCSNHVEENEGVIARALADRGRALGWEVEAGLLPTWPRRGVAVEGLSADECARMIRCDADEDLTNGFFVCGLRKRQPLDATAQRELVEDVQTADVQRVEGGDDGDDSGKEQKKKRKKRKKKRKTGAPDGSAIVEP